MKRRVFLVVLLALFNQIAFSQPVSIVAATDKRQILIGEQFQLTLQASFPRSTFVQWFSIDTIPHFEVLKRNKIDSGLAGNILTIKQTIILTSWDSGKWQLPPFFLKRSNKTKPIAISVSYSPFDPKQDYHDIKDILEVTRQKQTQWHWYVIGACLLLLLFILLFPSRKKKVTSTVVYDANIYKTSLEKLEKLKENIARTDNKSFYTELIHIYRDYLHKRKNIQSFSKTSDDLGIQIKQLNLSEHLFSPLLQTLRLSDLVKFAQYQTEIPENEKSIETIKQNIIAIENLK
ncbi:MAG: hypothetical protein ABR502_01865 [Chitinophagaceae bacterium]